MQFQTLLLSALAALATASPAPALDARAERAGRVLDSNQVYLAELIVTGGCIAWAIDRPRPGRPTRKIRAAYAEIFAKNRCRFYEYVCT
jgi:hypothetical protein